MGRIINIFMYCEQTKKRYKAFFEEEQPEEWSCIKVEQCPVSFVEKMQSALKPKGGSPFASLLGSKSGNNSKGSGGGANFKGAFYMGAHKCPYCGNTGFVKCGECENFTCHKDGDSRFRCGSCSNQGTVSGYIDSASGNITERGGGNGGWNSTLK